MALVIPPTPVDGPRRSPRIRTAVTRRTSRSRGADLPLVATNPQSVLAAASTASSSSRTRTVSRKKASPPASGPQSSPSLPIRAGTKRKRAHNSDRPARPAYELVPRQSNVDDDEAQTPRQLRYAKRQRLSGKENPAVDLASVRKGEERSGSRERVLHRASTEGRLLTPQPSITTCNSQPSSPR
ncbi:hypothetical protein L226DRAFT_266941 [Lentinus tigrinus ALCF2SS1-7]|uniref:uncharacterized protein n=1 Tax=Lentinus tigrinus ALCF2SS1-7 TaxID=1328758 RepID=UPI001165F6CA|nr:hypothetical protein L226DRAFT_266941 [Lentinus tigrinus ALCF2SS1-7]